MTSRHLEEVKVTFPPQFADSHRSDLLLLGTSQSAVTKLPLPVTLSFNIFAFFFFIRLHLTISSPHIHLSLPPTDFLPTTYEASNELRPSNPCSFPEEKLLLCRRCTKNVHDYEEFGHTNLCLRPGSLGRI